LTDEQYEILLTRITYNLRCAYVTTNHAWILHQQGRLERDTIIAMIHDWRSADLPPLESAVLAFADKMSLKSDQLSQPDTDALRAAGLSDARITALIFLIGWLVSDAVIPNALGAQLDEFSRDMREVIDWRGATAEG
jgi:alkylhydroperoxidase family enzyme